MALSVPVQKDIGEYEEKIMFGLSGRSLICLSCGVGIVIMLALVGWLAFGLSVKQLAIPIFVVMGGAFAIGYFKPLGLPFKVAMKLYFDAWFGDNLLFYKSSVYKNNFESKEEKVEVTKLNRKAQKAGERNDKKQAQARQKEYANLKRSFVNPELDIPRLYEE